MSSSSPIPVAAAVAAAAAAAAAAPQPTPAPASLSNATSSRHARSRTQSVSSDRPSTIARSLMSLPVSVSPEAAFIAASAASQIVTSDHDGHSESWYDQAGIEPSGETAVITPGALQLANNFVDQLLFNIIAVAGSTSLSALRPAVSDVLKPKLAKDAINQADEELREYLGGGEVEDLGRSPTTEPSRDWDLELAWKRARLRCMVYSSLGDLEEEDEDYYMEQEHLRGESDDILSESVSPAVAIFLTSILEFMGEQILVIAGQAAFNRLRVKYEKEFKDGSRAPGDVAERLVVEELDMERVALDRTIGRLWRAWKKRIRSPTEPNFSRPFSRNSIAASLSLPHTRPGSMATFGDRASPSALLNDPGFAKEEDETKVEETRPEEKTKQEAEIESKPAAEIRPAAIPLPMGGNDVAEIEVPGLVSYSDDEGSDEEDGVVTRGRQRPKSSILFFQHSSIETPTPTVSEPQAPAGPRRGRSNSLPTPTMPPYKSPSQADTNTRASATEQHAQEILNKDQRAEYVRTKVGSGANGTTGATPEIVQRIITTARGKKAQRTRAAGDEGETDDFEEAQILTTSRISIGGRSSPAVSEGGARPPSILIARSNSVGSARIINVQSPRSPSIGSRTGSWEVEYTRSADISREGSISAPTPPIPEEQEQDQRQHISANEGKKRSGFIVPPNLDVSAASGANLRSRSPPKNVASPSLVPAPVPANATSKVTILNTPTPRSSSLPENFDAPYKSSYRNAPLPTLPEKSTGRQTRGQTKTSTVPITPQQGSPESAKFERPKPADSPASTTSNKLKAFRNSEDSSPQRPTDIKRHFEELIHSDQTIQYTLTPEHMREASSSKSSRSIKDGSSVIHMPQDSEDTNTTTQPSRSRSRSSSKTSLSLSKATGLNSHPPTDVLVSGKHTGPGSKPPVSMPMKSRSGSVASASTARDARIPVDSTQDFADFIRGTGPQGTPKRVRAGSVTNARNDSPPVTAARSISSVNRSTSSLARARLQAREATTSSSNGSSELIDFIRRGPQDSASNNPRIPRHVAPFRNTMDSEQLVMSGATGGRAIDAVLPSIRDGSQASANVTDASAPSSFNSHSALLNKASKPTAYAHDNFDDEDMVPKRHKPAAYASNNFDDADMVPQRKQRRVRDPYAIDLSDEDDDLFEEIMPRPKPPKKEESLIDFLNSYEPPPEPEPKPIMAPPMLPKKKSAPNLISRLRAGAHSNSSTFSLARRASNADKMSHMDSRSLHSRASTMTRGHTPIAVNIPPGADKYAADLMPPPSRAQTSSSNRVPMKRYEARDAHSSATRGTSDLASFLRDSEPPPSTLASPASPANDKAGGGLSRMFERRKKSTVF